MPHPSKASLEDLKSAYYRLNSVWRVAEEFGMCGQSVHERLQRHGLIIPKQRNFYEKDDKLIKYVYETGIKRGDGRLNSLCKILERNKQTICARAGILGLTSYNRKLSKSAIKKLSIRSKKWLKKNEHPRGMLGKKHSPEVLEKLREISRLRAKSLSVEEKMIRVRKSFQTKLQRYGSISPINPNVTWKQGWREVGGKTIYFRSRWESNYGRYLQWLKEKREIQDWLHEPKVFWFEKIKRGSVTYLPDFQVFKPDGSYFWVEVKGWMDQRSKTKLKRFKKYFPKESLILVDSKWFKQNSGKMKLLIPGWEV